MSWKTAAFEALRLRGLALQALSQPEGRVDARTWQEALGCTPDSWRLFLTAERCAIRLERALESSGSIAGLPEAVAAVLRQRAREELARVLSARGQLRRVGEVAAELGVVPVVLKGAHGVFAGDPLDLSDIDVLLPSEQALALAAALDARGHEATFSNPQHLRARLTPQALPIEIHVTLDQRGGPPEERLWHGLTPIPSCPSLYRLSPAEHLWHVLRHATVDHATRRGRVRDLLLIADATSACDDADLATVRTRVHQHEYASTLDAVLTMALDISTGLAPADRFQRIAFAHYLVRGLTRRLSISHERSRDVAEATLALVQGWRESRALWRQRVLQTTQERSPYRFIGWVERRAPVLGRAWRVSVRSAYRAGVMTAALPIAGMAAHLSRRAGVGGALSDHASGSLRAAHPPERHETP